MDLLFNALKGQVNSLNLILVTALLSFLFYKLNRRRTGMVLAVFGFAFFFLFSTSYLPKYLIKRMESKYPPFNADHYALIDGTVYIHVLGAGYTFDERLPASGQLSPTGLSRLSEAIRIFNLFDNSILVVSGNIASGHVSLANVARKASIDLGVDSTRIVMLEDPSTTHEEAEALARRFGSTSSLIVVTDAVHMPRAIGFFSDLGIEAYPAPTNYLIKEDTNPFAFHWMPHTGNFVLMDRVWREVFGEVKGWFL
ncbi:MAG: ElyC/SanA/YdcF family protein [Cyclobacteriaceae bacterium]